MASVWSAFLKHVALANLLPGGLTGPQHADDQLIEFLRMHRPELQQHLQRRADLPEFPPRHRIGIKQRGLILRPSGDGPLAWSWARWSLVAPGGREVHLTQLL